jgi:hypothetical protein
MERMDRNAFAVEVLERACRGMILTDRRKPADRIKIVDRPDEATDVKSTDADPAA